MAINIPNILKIIWDTTINTNRWVKFMASIVIGAVLFMLIKEVLFKTKTEDCTVYKTQNIQLGKDKEFYQGQVTQLMNALLGIKKDINLAAENTNYFFDDPFEGNRMQVYYAVYDSVPKKKKQYQQQIRLKLINYKIDSILNKVRQQEAARVYQQKQ